MLIDRLLNSPTRRALELSASFAEQRQRVLAENMANIDSPLFQDQTLDVRDFESGLRSALHEARRGGNGELKLRDAAQSSTDESGRLVVKPTRVSPGDAADASSRPARVEELLTAAQQNAMRYGLASNLLKSRFDSLLTAVRGRTS